MKEVVCVPVVWTDGGFYTEVLKFFCPKCDAVTQRKKIQNVVLSITCKKCKQRFTLEYGEVDEIYDEYQNKKVIIHYPEIKPKKQLQ